MAGSKGGIEAGRAYVKAYLDDSLIKGGLRRMRTMFGSVGRTLAVGAVAGLTATGVLAASGLRKAMKSIEETAALDKVSKAFGLATEQASGLFAVFREAGSENIRENIESMVTMSQRIGDAMAGKGAQALALFDGLSITAQELSQLPLDEQFFRLHAAILQLPDPIDRVNRLMLAFGEDGGKTLIGTLSKSTEELREQAKAMQVSTEQAEKASAAQRSLNRASAAWNALWVKIATAAAPVLEKIAEGFTSLTTQLGEKFGTIESDWGGMVAGMRTSWGGFVSDVAAGTLQMESAWAATQAKFARFRLWITDFQDANPGIFDRDPLGLDPTGQNRQRRREQLEQRAKEAEQRADRLAGQASIAAAPPAAGVEIWKGTPIAEQAAQAVNRMVVAAERAAAVSSELSSAGTFSGRAAGTLGLSTNPVVEKLDEQTRVLKDIEANTGEGLDFS
jgi:hypothetical protein